MARILGSGLFSDRIVISFILGFVRLGVLEEKDFCSTFLAYKASTESYDRIALNEWIDKSLRENCYFYSPTQNGFDE